MITNISGRKVYETDYETFKGENQLMITKSDLKNAGIHIVRVNLNGSSAAQRMILIE